MLSWEMLHANRALSQPLHLHSEQWTGLGSCHSFSVMRGKHEGRALPGLGVGCGQGVHLPSWQSPAKTRVRRDFLEFLVSCLCGSGSHLGCCGLLELEFALSNQLSGVARAGVQIGPKQNAPDPWILAFCLTEHSQALSCLFSGNFDVFPTSCNALTCLTLDQACTRL